MTGWTCPSCGVNYAPSVTECRCSAAPVVDDQVRKWIDEFEKSDKPLTPQKAPVLPPWIDPWTPPVYPFATWTGDVVRPTLTVDPSDRTAMIRATAFRVGPDGSHTRYNVDFASLPSVDLSNVDYLQLASLGGRQ